MYVMGKFIWKIRTCTLVAACGLNNGQGNITSSAAKVTAALNVSLPPC